jgi:hypothetical protein
MMTLARQSSVATFFLALALSIIWSPASAAKITVIDDSGTQALEPAVSMRWRDAAPARDGADNTLLAGTTTVRVRLNVSAWLNRVGRIFLVLPMRQPGSMEVVWTTQGLFQAGQLQSGNRVLVYAGAVTTPFMEEVMRFQFSIDGSLIRQQLPVTLRFEMDED